MLLISFHLQNYNSTNTLMCY